MVIYFCFLLENFPLNLVGFYFFLILHITQVRHLINFTSSALRLSKGLCSCLTPLGFSTWQTESCLPNIRKLQVLSICGLRLPHRILCFIISSVPVTFLAFQRPYIAIGYQASEMQVRVAYVNATGGCSYQPLEIVQDAGVKKYAGFLFTLIWLWQLNLTFVHGYIVRVQTGAFSVLSVDSWMSDRKKTLRMSSGRASSQFGFSFFKAMQMWMRHSTLSYWT